MYLFIYFLCISSIFVDYAFSRSMRNEPTTTKCKHHNETLCHETGTACNTEIDCDLKTKNVCYVLWSNSTNGTLNVIFKGCFIESGDECKGQERCVEKGYSRHDGHLFCCCEGDYCNDDFIWAPTEPPPTVKVPAISPNRNDPFEYILWAFFPISMLVIMIFMLFLRKRKLPFFSQYFSLHQHRQCPPSPPVEKLRPIHLTEVVARGKYGAVWKGTFNNEPVAVKIMSSQNKQVWFTEQDVFKLPMMDHENVLHYIGAEKHGESNIVHSELWLITSYHELGSLHDFLKVNTITWDQLSHIVFTLSRGLAHLHEEIPAEKIEKSKPAIAHRDFKSTNILLKSDMSACIADFGLALVFLSQKKMIGETHGQVGTYRYMAPEVLEGAVTFCMDAFLKIDVYACGLVLWELANRCNSRKVIASEYKLPFQDEAGLHPTLEEMQVVVVLKELRPVIKPEWRRHAGLSLICETMEECWDQDADARATASCIMERVAWYKKAAASGSKTDMVFLEYKKLEDSE